MSIEYKLDMRVADACKIQLSEITETELTTVSELFERAKLLNHQEIEDNQDYKRVSDKSVLVKRVCENPVDKIQHPVPPPRPDPVLYTHIFAPGNSPAPNEKQDSSSTVVESVAQIQMEAAEEAEISASLPENSIEPENIASQPVETADTAEAPRGGRKSIGKWQLGKTIGEGSSGKVKLAQHQDTKETVLFYD